MAGEHRPAGASAADSAIDPPQTSVPSAPFVSEATQPARPAAQSAADDPGIGAALEAAQVGEWAIDLVTGEVTVSALVRRLLELPEQGPVRIDDIERCCHPDDRGAIQAIRAATVADPSKGFIRHSFRIELPDGGSRWFESRSTIYRNRDGRAVRLLGLLLDVTDRQERERLLEQSWHRFEAALANTAIVVFEQDQDLRYTWIHNPPVGYEAHRILGRTDAEIMGPDYAPDITAKKRRVLETALALQTEVTVPLGHGRGFFDLHIAPLRDARGAIVGIACAGIDLAETARAERAHGNRRPGTKRQTVEDRNLLLDKVSARFDPQRHRGLLPIGMSALARKLGGSVTLSADDYRQLQGLETRCSYVAAKQPLDVSAAAAANSAWLIGNGWAYSCNLLTDGRRQVIGFHLPGDVIGLAGPTALGGGAGRAWATASDCVVCALDRRRLDAILGSSSRLAQALHRAAATDTAIIEQHLVSIGRRSAEARLAHLLLELGARLEAVQLADSGGFRCPLTQELIADALGLTNVHVNRLLRRLRDQGLLTFMRGFVAFQDKPRLIELAEYDPTFLALPDAATPPRKTASG